MIVDSQIYNKGVAPGKNGPHQHRETVVRNSCHWAISCLNCFRWTGDDRYLSYARFLMNGLLEAHATAGHVTFYARDHAGRDRCNGLIGQAWVLEALLKLYETTTDDRYLKAATGLFDRHDFSSAHGLWHTTDIDGNRLGFDPTFNHQLWFAASIAPLVRHHPAAEEQLGTFTARLYDNLTVLSDGLIFHPIDRDLNRSPDTRFRTMKLLKEKTISPSHAIRSFQGDPGFIRLIYVSQGYQLFNLYAFASLTDRLQGARASQLEKALGLLKRDTFWQVLDENTYAYPYNAPGFELPFIYERFPGAVSEDRLKKVWKMQIEKTFSSERTLFDVGTPDGVCLTARIYELSQCQTSTLMKLSG